MRHDRVVDIDTGSSAICRTPFAPLQAMVFTTIADFQDLADLGSGSCLADGPVETPLVLMMVERIRRTSRRRDRGTRVTRQKLTIDSMFASGMTRS